MLLADEVSHVRVYEEQNAEDTHRGLKHSEKEQVIDVKTKASIVALTSMEAQLSAGADGALAENGAMQGRYYARAMAEFNSEMNNASAYIGADNVTSGLEGSKYTFVPSVSRTGFGPLQSYNENLGGKLYFEHRWKDRRYGNLIGAGYSTTHSYSRSASRALSEYFETYNSPARSYIDTTIGTARQMNHDFVLNGDFKNTILNDLAFSLNGTVKESNNYGHSSNLLISSLGRVRQNTITGNNGNDVKINGSFIWKNNDLGKIRPRLTLSGAFANNNTLSWNTDTLSSSYIRRNLQSDGLGKSWKIEAKSDLDIVLANDTQKTSKLNFAAFAGTEKSIKRNITVDIINPDSPVRDFANTYDYSWNTVSGGLSQNYTMTKGKETFKVSLTESISSQRDEEHFPARISYNHLYFDLRPEISYNNKLFSAGISAQSQIPSVEQTRNRITDRNPLVLSGGNPELKQSYTVNASVLDNIFMDKKTGMNIGCSLYASYTFKPIVTRSFYFKEDTSLDAYNNYLAKKGAVLNTFVNSPRPAYNLGGSISLSHRAQAVKLNSSLKLNASLNSLPQFLRDKLAKISTYRLGAEVKEAYRPNKKLSINLNLEASYLNSQSDISGLLTSAIVSEARLGATYNFTRNTYLNAAGALNRHDYIAGAGKSNIYAPMSISISHRLKNLSIHISAQDLLNKASNYTTSTTADYHMARWTPSYGRYFLCGVIYEFRKKR